MTVLKNIARVLNACSKSDWRTTKFAFWSFLHFSVRLDILRYFVVCSTYLSKEVLMQEKKTLATGLISYLKKKWKHRFIRILESESKMISFHCVIVFQNFHSRCKQRYLICYKCDNPTTFWRPLFWTLIKKIPI